MKSLIHGRECINHRQDGMKNALDNGTANSNIFYSIYHKKGHYIKANFPRMLNEFANVLFMLLQVVTMITQPRCKFNDLNTHVCILGGFHVSIFS